MFRFYISYRYSVVLSLFLTLSFCSLYPFPSFSLLCKCFWFAWKWTTNRGKRAVPLTWIYETRDLFVLSKIKRKKLETYTHTQASDAIKWSSVRFASKNRLKIIQNKLFAWTNTECTHTHANTTNYHAFENYVFTFDDYCVIQLKFSVVFVFFFLISSLVNSMNRWSLMHAQTNTHVRCSDSLVTRNQVILFLFSPCVYFYYCTPSHYEIQTGHLIHFLMSQLQRLSTVLLPHQLLPNTKTYKRQCSRSRQYFHRVSYRLEI